ncbi:MAG: glycoside hydrolase family 3 C-terminal domain-containing protein [Lachnospiraceae bacterium]|nr:glycoside hydrolase family 3 C-terminal domain-containing protein [Lachnospiraceae bacterium]
MLSINMDDVMAVVNNIRGHIIAFVVVLVLGIIAMIAAGKFKKPEKKLVRGEAGLAIILTLLIVANLICRGPMSNLLDLATGGGSIEAETSAAATELVSTITEEGVVLAQNTDTILPVASGSKLNVFGWASTNPCYGGTGSGALNTAYPTVDLLAGLNEAGIETNTELSKFYTDYKSDRPSVAMWSQDWTLPEPNVSAYSDELISNAKAFSDTAMIVITRVGGEGADLPTDMPAVVDGSWLRRTASEGNYAGMSAGYYAGTYDDSLNEGNDWDEGDHFLQLSNREEEMIDLVCENFDNVILVYNGANAFELGFVKDYEQIKGVILCPGTGQSGFAGFGKVVSGAINPSGRTVDTYVANMKNSPWWNNFGDFNYTNMDGAGNGDATFFDPAGVCVNFVNYVEGIYVGYKYYETAAAEGFIKYEDEVVYPFGYGLSYTSFEKTMSDIETDGTNISFSVTVKNTGSTAGKDVVEIYMNPPYTDGGIEKASANLIDFAKTSELAAGASETIDFTIPLEQLASYDYLDKGCYVLEAGDYVISVNSNSHDIDDSKTLTLAQAVVYDESNKRESDDTAAVNQFDFADGGVTYLSRADGFANYEEATAAPTNFEMSAENQEGFYDAYTYISDGAPAEDAASDAEAITTGASNGLTLSDMRGLDYDDPKWDDLLDQLTIDEMNTLIGNGGYQTVAIDSVGKVRTNDCDGPASINNNFTGVGSVGFPAATLIAATWSKDLAYNFGDSIGEMADQMDTSGWYAPAMNIHRTAFAGRNFEYYSEDGLLSGAIAAAAVNGSQDHEVYAYMKHYALNDQEGNRTSMLCTWSNEQAIREIYLKPFEICVKEADCKAVMSSFNYVGNRWSGGCRELQTVVLRDEWGFRGFVETDYFGVYGYMNADQAVRAGSDLMLSTVDQVYNYVTITDSAAAQQALRTSAKNILYVVANSRAYQEENLHPGMASWEKALLAATVIIGLLLAFWEFKLISNYMKRKKEA